MPIGDATTAPTCRIDVGAQLHQIAAATASERAAMPTRCGCAGANADVLVGMPSRTSVMMVPTLTLPGAACKSRIQHVAHTKSPNAMTLTTRKLRTTLPVIEYAMATASGNAGPSLSTAEPACKSWLTAIAS